MRKYKRRLKKKLLKQVLQNQYNSVSQTQTKATNLVSCIYTFKSELDKITEYVLDFPSLETGGSLWGWFDKDGSPVIGFVTGPGDNPRNLRPYAYTPNEEYDAQIEAKINALGFCKLGVWHSHHKLGLLGPSKIDCYTMDGFFNNPINLDTFFICGIASILESNRVVFRPYFFEKHTHSHTLPSVKVFVEESPLRSYFNYEGVDIC